MEGLFFRFIMMAPYRCHDCGARFRAFGWSHVYRKRSKESLAEYLGMRGREHKIRHWILTIVATLLMLIVAVFFVLRFID